MKRYRRNTRRAQILGPVYTNRSRISPTVRKNTRSDMETTTFLLVVTFYKLLYHLIEFHVIRAKREVRILLENVLRSTEETA